MTPSLTYPHTHVRQVLAAKGQAMVIFHEGRKMRSGRGQYKGGKEGDENEEFMEMQDGGLIVT